MQVTRQAAQHETRGVRHAASAGRILCPVGSTERTGQGRHETGHGVARVTVGPMDLVRTVVRGSACPRPGCRVCIAAQEAGGG